MLAHPHCRPLRRLRFPAGAVTCVALASAFGFGAMQAHAAPLTLADALRLAHERSRQLPALEASAAASRQIVIPAAYLLMRRPRETRVRRWAFWRSRRAAA